MPTRRPGAARPPARGPGRHDPGDNAASLGGVRGEALVPRHPVGEGGVPVRRPPPGASPSAAGMCSAIPDFLRRRRVARWPLPERHVDRVKLASLVALLRRPQWGVSRGGRPELSLTCSKGKLPAPHKEKMRSTALVGLTLMGCLLRLSAPRAVVFSPPLTSLYGGTGLPFYLSSQRPLVQIPLIWMLPTRFRTCRTATARRPDTTWRRRGRSCGSAAVRP